MKLTLASADGDAPIDLEPSALLLFVDETGQEEFADASYPVFGLAGVAIMVTEYESVIAGPWRVMKDRLFHGREKPLHAANLKRLTQEQLAALSQFFRDPRFSRFAAVVTRDTKIPKGISPYQLAAVSLPAPDRTEHGALYVLKCRTDGGVLIAREPSRGTVPWALRQGAHSRRWS